jgi:hypothetical protein
LHPRFPIIASAVLLAACAGCGRGPEQVWPLQSPDGRLTVFVEQSASGSRLSFRVVESRTGAAVGRPAPLEPDGDGGRFDGPFAFISQSPARVIEDSAIVTDRGVFRMNALETSIVFENAAGGRIRFDWIAADGGGIAFRRAVPSDVGVRPGAWRVAAPAGADAETDSLFAEALRRL